jgi:predicted ATPase/DNA-binding CsgD family transcriptional regulator
MPVSRPPSPEVLANLPPVRPPPVVRTSFVGRAAELAEIDQRLAEAGTRLVTIVGRSGVGKTRLAIEVAHRQQGLWLGGVVFVELDRETGRGLIAEVVGTALGTEVTEGQAAEEAIRRRLRRAPALIVVDDLDLTTDALPGLLDLVSLSPATRILATAQRPTGHATEHVVRLRPLAVAPESLTGAAALAEVPAIALYVQRAAALDAGFTLDDRNATAVAELTRRLDGLPLAIELGAARARIMPPSAQLAALDEHSPLDLRARRADARPERHRDVRAAVAASYALAASRDQAVLRHLSVFAAGCTSSRLCDVTGDSRGTLADILDALVELVDLGLVEVDADRDGEPRYRLLPTIASYARERLESEAEASDAERRHEDTIRAAARQSRGLSRRKQVDVLARDANELHLVFARLVAQGRPKDALELACDLAPLWFVRGLFEGPGAAFAELVDAAEREDLASNVMSRALLWWASLAVHRATPAKDRVAIRRRLARGLELARAADDPALLLFALNAVVEAVFVTGDMAGVAAATGEGLLLASKLADRSAEARFEYRAAIFALAGGDAARAATLAGSALAKTIEDGDLRSTMYATFILRGLPPGTPGMPDGVPTLEGLLDSAIKADEQALSVLLHARIAAMKLDIGDIQSGAAWALRCLALAEDLGAWYASGFCIAWLARTAASRGEASDAARLHGSLTPIASEVFVGLGPGGVELYQAAIAPARAQLGPGEFDRLAADAALLDRDASVAAAAGYARTLLGEEQASAVTRPSEAVQLAAVQRPQPSMTGAEDTLTPREHDVLRELMTGATNQQIAEVLGLRPKTVMHHSVSIYSKLGVRGRTEATAWAYRNGFSTRSDDHAG